MKKTLFVVGLLVSVLVVLGVAGLAFAQDDPPTPEFPQDGSGEWLGHRHGSGMWGDKSHPGEFGGGMWGSHGSGEYGPMHEYMINELAEVLPNNTPAEIEARIENGETMKQIAEEAGLSAEDFSSLMFEARQAALEQAVADGDISKEQADWMIQRFEERQTNGFGPGSCFGSGGHRGGGHMDPSWDTQSSE